ncbi:hypothetical protein [Marinomonas rhodophyticola]|uniref:Uncharacterized protein n=1 Tax=Marinomonas rhodophyticola TaxID=2992803 RepID=A0ABT3KGX6_9GAMM|nr:hypothetical protein [Marinomonas sp. KJ51-3]MCW4629798.1 hypothetical protein [Marinomonas sp. KJ51-3]
MFSLNSLIVLIDKLITMVVTPIVVGLSAAVAFILAWGVFSRSILDIPVFGLEEPRADFCYVVVSNGGCISRQRSLSSNC